MSAFYTLLTNAGRAKLAAALALGEPLALHEMALGDGNGNPVTPLASMSALVHQVYRADLNSVTLDPANPNFIVCELIVPAASGGWNIRECGIYDDENTLIAIGNFPETYKPLPAEGSARDLVIRNIIAVENTAAVNLVINANVVVANQAWVITQLNELTEFNDGRYEPLGAVAEHVAATDPHNQYLLKNSGALIAAYGVVSASGAKISGSANWTVTRNSAGHYQLNVTDAGNYIVLAGTAPNGDLAPASEYVACDTIHAFHYASGYFQNNVAENIMTFRHMDGGGWVDCGFIFYAIKI